MTTQVSRNCSTHAHQQLAPHPVQNNSKTHLIKPLVDTFEQKTLSASDIHQQRKKISKSIPSLITREKLPVDLLSRLGPDFLKALKSANDAHVKLSGQENTLDLSNPLSCLSTVLKILPTDKLDGHDACNWVFINIDKESKKLIFDSRFPSAPDTETIDLFDVLKDANQDIRDCHFTKDKAENQNKLAYFESINRLLSVLLDSDNRIKIIHNALWGIIEDPFKEVLRLEKIEAKLLR